jgi:peroxiredoxin
MRITIIVLLATIALASCQDKSSNNRFTVTGTIIDGEAKKIYLEEVPASSMQPILVDSAELDKNGKFTLHAEPEESIIFNLRLDKNMYPVASVINDNRSVDIKVRLSKENQQFAESYEVSGSEGTKQMRDFMVAFNGDLQKIFVKSGQVDSLRDAGTADSLLLPLETEKEEIAGRIMNYSLEAFDKATDPALLLFELGYYQSTANGAGFGLKPLGNDQVEEIVAKGAKKFPAHSGIASVNNSLQQQKQKAMTASWIGKEAPDFSMPDVNGKEVKLSSFRGKYVLVDFWASWCRPCREENPNVVSAYQQFKAKNFTVLGVSLDRPDGKEQWINAIKADKLDWTHISDLKFWDSKVIPLYHFEGIPFNVLVDPKGIVVAESLRGKGLADKLSEVL